MFDYIRVPLYHEYMGIAEEAQHIGKEANSLDSLRFLARLISRRHIALSSAPRIQRSQQNSSDPVRSKPRKARRVRSDPKTDSESISAQDSGT